MTLEYRMSQYMDIQTHRCRFCGGQFMPTTAPNLGRNIVGTILFIMCIVKFGIFSFSFPDGLISLPLLMVAVGLMSIKRKAWKCHQCEREFIP